MGKIKKIYKIPLYILLALILITFIGALSMRSPAVQTWLFEKYSSRFSRNNEIELSAGSIRFTFFNKLEVNKLLIKDNTADTMLYSPKVSVGIRRIKPKDRFISLGRIAIDRAVIKLRPDTNKVLNITHLTEMFARKDTTRKEIDLLIRQLDIKDSRLSYRSGSAPDTSDTFDMNNIDLLDINLRFNDFNKEGKAMKISIPELSFMSSEGFRLENLSAGILIEDGKYIILDPSITTEHSFISSESIGLDMSGRDAGFDFIHDANLELILNSSVVSLADLAYFIEPLRGMENEIILSGDISGTVSEINGRDIHMSYSDSTMLICDFDLSGLPDIDNTFMFIRVGSFTTTTHEIADLEIPGIGRLDPGDELMRLGAISFDGNFTGFTRDFVTYGTINTELGSVSTDILFRPDTSNTFYYKGSLEAQEVRMGKILDMEDILGSLSAELEVEGILESISNFRADIEATVSSLVFKDYTYSDINISGLVTERVWDGKVSSNTEDLKMDLLGRFDFTGDLPEVDFSLNLLEADLYRLNFDRTDSLSNLSMLLTASFTGNNIDNLNGDIRLLNSKLKRNGDEFDLFDCSLSAFRVDSTTGGINLRTDYVDADIRGKYNLATITGELRKTAACLLPSLIHEQAGSYSGSNDFSYEVRLKNTDRLNEFFNTGFMVSPGFIIKGQINPGNVMEMTAGGDYAIYRNNSLLRPELNWIIKDTTMLLDVRSERLNMVNNLNMEKLALRTEAVIDTIDLSIDWENSGNLENKGTLTTRGIFSQPDSINTRLSLAVLPAEMIINGKPWKVDRSKLIIDSTALLVDRFMVSREEEYLLIDGKVSEDPSDSINISFNGLNLAGLNKLENNKEQEGKEKITFLLEGLLSGRIILTDIFNNPMFETDVRVNDFRLNDQEHGDISILSVWDNNKKVAGISLSNDKKGINTFTVDGEYDPSEKDLWLIAEVKRMPLDILNLFLKSFASDVSGLGSGKVRISREKGDISLSGSVMAEEASMTVDYLQSNFSFSDSIRFSENKILFNNIELGDNRNNRAVIDGFVAYDNFKDFNVDLRIDADNTLALDTRQEDNSLFYGTAYASGVITIRGPSNDLALNISARTERNTRVFIPLGAGDEISDYAFITFREEGQDTEEDKYINIPIINRDASGKISLNFELEVTPDAEVQLVFDSKLGDVMKARGTGTLNMALDDKGDFTIFGDYVIEDGEYQLTLGNIFNKRFVVEEGGTIAWNGDIMNANVDAKAIYRLKASLEDLFQDPAYAARIPVECHLNMSGQLVNPIIGFDIYLPTADESMRTDLRAAIDSEEEMSRQFLYLLVMNSFYPDPALTGSSLNTTSAGASAMGVTTTEMLSNQLSNWLSQISSDFDIGFTYRPGNEISNQEVEVALSTQLLNDRVIINGNFDVGGEAGGLQSSPSANEITGDFDVEVKLTEKFRFKVFNRSNDNLVYETAPYTQGIGLFFRQSFNSFSDLFKRKKNEMKREDEVEIVEE